MERKAIQDAFPLASGCFGCGPDNPVGFQLKSHLEGEELVAEWTSEPLHQGPPGVVNGGVLAIPMDCNSTWMATLAFQKARGSEYPVPAVTAEYSVRLRRPTPTGRRVLVRSRADAPEGRKVRVHTTAEVDGEVTAIFEGTFVAVGSYDQV